MNTQATKSPLSFWRGMFFLLLGTGLVLTVIRFTKGLGAVSNLSDEYPWGLWVGFDLLCGVGLAAGGFVITAVVYIFHIESWRPIVRPAILTAFLGYLLVVAALMFDLGKPWNIWHPLIMWNPHSVMFEVAWCVMLYSAVLGLEFSGMVFERLRWQRAVKVQKMISVPLVILGVILSTLHQSSLGTVYLIVPGKLHALWYTPILPILFWVSAISVGLAMTIVESRLSARAFGRKLELPLLSKVGRVLVGVLGLYGVLRIYDLATRGALGEAFTFSFQSCMFLLEFVAGVLLPIVLLSIPKMRVSPKALYGAALLAVMGFVTHRLNVSMTGYAEGAYVPAWSEIAVTLMFIALGFAAFRWAVMHLNVYPEDEADHHAPATMPAPVARVPETAPWERVLLNR